MYSRGPRGTENRMNYYALVWSSRYVCVGRVTNILVLILVCFTELNSPQLGLSECWVERPSAYAAYVLGCISLGNYSFLVFCSSLLDLYSSCCSWHWFNGLCDPLRVLLFSITWTSPLMGYTNHLIYCLPNASCGSRGVPSDFHGMGSSRCTTCVIRGTCLGLNYLYLGRMTYVCIVRREYGPQDVLFVLRVCLGWVVSRTLYMLIGSCIPRDSLSILWPACFFARVPSVSLA